jgi:hypothetical protein
MPNAIFQINVLPAIGDRVRIALLHEGVWRPLIWFRVGNDGSIYIGLLTEQPFMAKVLSKEASRVVAIKYDETQDLKELPSSSRISFKASGEIHFGDQKLDGIPLAQLSRTRQLCLFHLAHPSTYTPPKKHLAHDYDVGIAEYPVDEKRPLYGGVIVAPSTAGQISLPSKLSSMIAAASVCASFSGLTRTPDLIVQVLIGHGVEGPWPELPGVVILSKTPPFPKT